MIKCSECGYENLDGLDYCDGCGAKLEASASESTGTAPAPEAASAATAASASEAAVSTPPERPNVTGMGATVESSSGLSSADVAASENVAPSRAPTGEMKTPQAAAPAPVAAGAPFKAKLTIIRGTIPERRNHEFELEPGRNLIGRWDPDTGSFPEVDLDADDPEAKISRKHAMLIIEGGKITIEDIGSLNGTFVNRQQRLMPGTAVELKDGDEIIIGKTFLKLTISPIS
jgi:hypothetical protein